MNRDYVLKKLFDFRKMKIFRLLEKVAIFLQKYSLKVKLNTFVVAKNHQSGKMFEKISGNVFSNLR